MTSGVPQARGYLVLRSSSIDENRHGMPPMCRTPPLLLDEQGNRQFQLEKLLKRLRRKDQHNTWWSGADTLVHQALGHLSFRYDTTDP